MESTQQQAEVDFEKDPIKKDILSCAKHALIMEYRGATGGNPSDAELAVWAKPFINDQGRVKGIVERRNRSVLMFAGKYPDFWQLLAKLVVPA